ncbi:TonB-dependent receptor [Kordiimonas pumila]|uniref:TonB-dependent receptor n=1 Tax=Kordiimonas pumila TaxID=2161677 RepID=A0ABV7D888_9PROT|nr:TonB-dependent receptor [Kordiimonas pumila]
MKYRKTLYGRTSIVSMAVMCMAVSASAQETSDGVGFELEEIIVTGEKVSRSLKDTASSVTVLTATDNGSSSVAESIADLANIVYAGSVSTPTIRGQDTQGPNFGGAAFFGGTVPRASINIDGHYQNFYEYSLGGTSVWDLKSIEVFRGPQTTSQGANSIAGAIIVNTNDPTFEPEASYLAELASYDKIRGAFAVSGPLVADELAARVAIDYWQRDTFIDYINPAFVQGDTDHEFRSFSARTKLLWTPSAIEGFSAKLTYSHTSGNRPTWEMAGAPYEDLNSMSPALPSWKQNTDTGILDIEYAISESLTLVNQSRYSDQHIVRTAEPATNGSAVVNQTNLSNETRLNYNSDSSDLSGFVGVFVEKTDSDDTLSLRGTSAFEDEKKHLGVFTEVSYGLSDRLTFTGGLRYQSDSVERTGTASFATVPLDYDEDFNVWLPKASIAYDVSDELTFGVLVNKGYNPGGVNLSFAGANFVYFDQETAWNYELFFRGRMLDNRLSINGNIFYTDYTDSQRQIPDFIGTIPYGAVAVNADSAEAYGLELEMKWLVSDTFSIKAAAGLMETKISEFTTPGGAVYVGNDFLRAPKYNFNIGFDWDLTSKMTLTAKVRHSDGYYSDEENLPDYEVSSYTVANANLSYVLDEVFEVYVYANNIFDDRSPTSLESDRAAGGIVAAPLDPRTFGIGFKGKF